MPSAPPEPAAPASAAAVEEAAEAERKAKAKAEEEEATKKQAAEKEEEERRKAAEAEEAARKQREAEEAATRAEELAAQARRNGKARFRYEMYDQEFEIANGSLTQEVIDEEFAFTFVMPGCHVHLSESSPSEVTALKNQVGGGTRRAGREASWLAGRRFAGAQTNASRVSMCRQLGGVGLFQTQGLDCWS